MALIGLMLAVVAPSIGRQLSSRTQQSELEVILSELFAVPAKAMYDGRKIIFPEIISGPVKTPLDLPAGWTLVFSPALVVTPLPACSGSTLTVRYGDAQKPVAVYEIEQGTCKLRAIHEHANP
jgi:hypothetical protein